MPFPTTSRHARGYGTQWDKLRLVILARDKYICRCKECARTGRIRPANHVDHVVPKARGGTDDPSNLQAIHRDCHKLKSEQESSMLLNKKPIIGLDGFPIERSSRPGETDHDGGG